MSPLTRIAVFAARPILALILSLFILQQAWAVYQWPAVQPGLWLHTFHPTRTPDTEDDRLHIAVLKIDPGFFSFHLLTASENDETNKTLPEWMQAYDLVAAINASMFWKDQRTSTGFMKNYSHVNNNSIHPKYEGFVVFNPIHPSLPEIQILDKEHHPHWKQTLQHYHSAVQSFRMISSKGENVWEQNSKRFSVACVGLDAQGKVLFIFCQTPTTIHDLNNVLLRLPLNIESCMFLEGGPTAGLRLNSGNFQKSWKGTSETFLGTDVLSRFVQLPNVIGISTHKDAP